MTELNLHIEVGSDPIAGSVDRTGRESRQFSGWIELVALIECAREAGEVGGERLGSFPGAKAAES